LEIIYGIKHGNNQWTRNNFASPSYKELSKQINLTERQIQNYKSLGLGK